jgi:8-oxo-dGTP diphosphatase
MPDVRWHLSTLVYVVHNGRLLLMHRLKQPNLGLWSPPGGKIEPGESPIDSALRELEEETGLQGTEPRLAAVVSEFDDVRREAWLMFVVAAGASDPTLRYEGREGECAWVALEDVADLPQPPADRFILDAVLDEEPGFAFLTAKLRDGQLQSVTSARSPA